MAEILINTGKIKLDINRDGENVGVFMFNPTNLEESKRHAEILSELEKNQEEQLARAKQLDENGTEAERINFIMGFVDDMRTKIDIVYGDGTSEMLFGDCYSAEVVTDFFTQLKPYYEKASNDRKSKYTSKK